SPSWARAPRRGARGHRTPGAGAQDSPVRGQGPRDMSVRVASSRPFHGGVPVRRAPPKSWEDRGGGIIMGRQIRRMLSEGRTRPVVACLLATFGPAHAQVAQGPMVQAVTSAQAGVWVRTAIAQPVRVLFEGPDHVVSTTGAIVTDPASD